MDMFTCDKCNHNDAVEQAYTKGTNDDGSPRTEWLCTKCQTGKWHDLFDYEEYQAEFDIVVNRPNGLGLG